MVQSLLGSEEGEIKGKWYAQPIPRDNHGLPLDQGGRGVVDHVGQIDAKSTLTWLQATQQFHHGIRDQERLERN